MASRRSNAVLLGGSRSLIGAPVGDRDADTVRGLRIVQHDILRGFEQIKVLNAGDVQRANHR
ncbi:uroporphyrinogen-III methylase [Zymobacter palmae]|uniref:Uroporphyrinogen-III methylase n=1 Tax=Zymobacter palmae TaxID=33074 RepID=A0A348HI78_9GAMM|nr:uroporphyrinogen-III methylase [Zymobacter palmae]